MVEIIERLLSGVASGVLELGEPSFWLPPQVSTVARSVDWLFYFILGVSIVFFLIIVVVMGIFLVKYRRREDRLDAEETPRHNLALEISWSVIPLALVVIIFFFGFKGFLDISTPPANAYEIYVEGQKWNWSFAYPNGYVDADLHVPVDRPVRLVMSSADVIHSLYVPAFRIKNDVVPGRYSHAWFEATEVGEYELFCAEYCGTSHSDMIAHVVVHPPGEFETWLEKASNFLETMTPVDAGRKLYSLRGCQQCHSVDGTAKVGPTLSGIFGHDVSLVGGQSIVVDENYLRRSLLEPAVDVVAGYEPVMPTYQGRLKDGEINAIIEYIKSLTDEEEGGP
ncbi:MAG: cytochrome c oxidase subunit II [bacterium]|nr:cytochrome c oxidase subunit II [bacterium]